MNNSSCIHNEIDMGIMYWENVWMNGLIGFDKWLTYGNLIDYLFKRLYICLEISVLGYRWRIAMIVVETAGGLGELKPIIF